MHEDLMRRRAWPLLLAMMVAGWITMPLNAWADKPVDVQTLVAEALANNPEIKASEAQWQVMVARAAQAGALEDPMMMVRIQNALLRDPLDFRRDSMTAKVIGISQQLPFYGKRDLMREEAQQGAEVERWVVEERRLALQRMVKENWARLYGVDRSLETVDATIALLDDLIRLAEAMYAVGKSSQPEVFQAQLERSKMMEMRIVLAQQRQALTATLNSLAYRPATTTYPPLPPLSRKSYAFAATDLEQLARSHRPALKSLQARIERSDAGVRLAQRQVYPDFTVSLEYMQREPAMGSAGDDMYGAQLSFNLPIQVDRRQAKVTEMEAERRMGVWERENFTNQIRQALGESLAQLERAQQLIRLYEQGILTQSRGAVDATLAGYRSATASLAEVLSAHLNQFNNQREYHGAVAEQQMQLAVLENIVGTALPEGRR